MKKILAAAAVFVFMAGIELCHALDYKKLYQAADNTRLSDAFMRVQADPASVEDLYILGLVYLNLHKDQQAKAIFSDILNIAPNALEAKWGIAEALRREHLLDKSRKLLEEVLKARPGFAPACISLAYIKYLRRDFRGAVILAEEVLRQGSDKVDLSNYVRAYLILGGSKMMIAHYGGPLAKIINYAAVLPNLKKAGELKSDFPAVLFGMGAFYLLTPKTRGGDIDAALEYLKGAVKADPLLADAYARLAQAYQAKGDDANYDLYLRRALEIDPGNELALDIQSGSCKFICVGGKDH